MLINFTDVVDGALVNAIALTGRRVSVAVDGLRGRRRADDLTAARWFETYSLTHEAPDLPDLSPALRDRLAAILSGDEIQAALQELLAARLTDAPEADAASARQVLSLTLNLADAARFAEPLAEYYDDQICALVGRLEAEDPPLLAQIRSEAFSTRMINVLAAIERHTGALTTRPAQRTEASFLTRYRRHVIDQHGKLEPPDFDRRRRVPIADIYVPTTITEDRSPDRALVQRSADRPSIDVYNLAERIDRSVLLGDPGGGKTTAANVLMHHFAQDAAGPIPFLVTLRDYAAKDPPEHSVVGHVEHILEIFYQCPAPAGLVDLLLLTGRAVVIFDGLDELLDTSRRADVTTRVERFCTEYPLARVFVTSRMVGYDQARLDDRQFTCYRLAGFTPEQVGEYARKWFVQDADARPDDAETFLNESASVPDLRSNPLLLSLMCILYRGQGSLPRDRAGVYEQCSDLLFRRWDARRRIHQDLRAGHLVEPALRHLAWWLFTRDLAQPIVTERDLVEASTGFLHGRGFEAEEDARAAAREFVEFCHGRMWVFSDAGTTAAGEKLYAFTHRTFLEYFAGAQLAYDSDTPEQLASNLLPRVARNEWWVVSELAVQIKDRTSNSGAQRIYTAFLSESSPQVVEHHTNVLRFLALSLRSVDPSPGEVRKLTDQILNGTFANEGTAGNDTGLTGLKDNASIRSLIPWRDALRQLLVDCGSYRGTVADEINKVITETVESDDHATRAMSLSFAASFPTILDLIDNTEDVLFWDSHVEDLMRMHTTAMLAAAETDAYVRIEALQKKMITADQALRMPGGLSILFQETYSFFARGKLPYLESVYIAFQTGWTAFTDPATVADLTAVGRYLQDNPEAPWLRGGIGWFDEIVDNDELPEPANKSAQFNPATYLGAAAILSILTEHGRTAILLRHPLKIGPLCDLVPYLSRRRGVGRLTKISDLPVPDDFKQTFRDWAEGRVNFSDRSDTANRIGQYL